MSIRVLIIDDHLIVRQAIAQLLIDAGLGEVNHVGSGLEGLHAVEELKPQVVLLDVRMPDMDGFTVLSRLRSRKHSVKVLMITSFDDSECRIRAMELGADGLFSKSISCDALIAAIRDVAVKQDARAPCEL